MAKLTLALVLCDVAAHGLKAGSLLEADPALIKALAADGSVDPHKEAVAAAQERGCPRARSVIELAAEQRAVAADALRVEIAQAEALLAAAADEATKAALGGDLTAKRAELAQILG